MFHGCETAVSIQLSNGKRSGENKMRKVVRKRGDSTSLPSLFKAAALPLPQSHIFTHTHHQQRESERAVRITNSYGSGTLSKNPARYVLLS